MTDKIGKENMNKKSKMFELISLLALIVISIFGVFYGIKKQNNENLSNMNLSKDKINIVTTLYPTYDFAKNIVKDKGNVNLILPAGVESHSYEPTPQDIEKINKSDVFIYTGEEMEPWAKKIAKQAETEGVFVVNSSKNIEFVESKDYHEDEKEHIHEEYNHGNKDPHIWLDPVRAEKMVENILEGILEKSKKDKDKEFFKINANKYIEQLKNLDAEHREVFENVKYKTLMYAGHSAFGTFANRYGLKQVSPYEGFSPNAQPSAKKLSELIKNVKDNDIKIIYYEELIEPKIAKLISEEAGVKMELLHGLHNLSAEERKEDKGYIYFMKDNLEKLKIGLKYEK